MYGNIIEYSKKLILNLFIKQISIN